MIADLKNMTSKFFSTTKRGEIHEMKTDLNSEYRSTRKEGVKNVIASMTVGKDVSGLFPDVVKNMQTDDLELKKLIYLYLINYAKSQPELDSDDINPLIRSLAIRTMGCLRVDKITDYLCEPLRKALKDPYVRKTAAIAVAKLYDINAELAVDNGFIELLLELVEDSNPMVVSNAITSLIEINELSISDPVFVINTDILSKLLRALNECTEWGQITIMECLADYCPETAEEAQEVCERILPRLSHANASVVLTAIRLLLQYVDQVDNEELEAKIMTKMAPPLEKLEVLIKLSDEDNFDQVLSEYANEVDAEFVRKSIKSISRCAMKMPEAAPKCVQALVDLLSKNVDYVVEEIVIAMKDIFRMYSGEYDGVISLICQNIELISSPESRAAMVWIISEHALQIEDSVSIFKELMNDFEEETTQVKIQLLTAAVKIYFKKPNDVKSIVMQGLKNATDSDNPDVRDRALIYYRLLFNYPDAAKNIVLNHEHTLSEDFHGKLKPAMVNQLMRQLTTLSSVYHLLPSQFLKLDNHPSSLNINTTGSLNPPSDPTQLTPDEINKASQRDQEPEELLIAF